MDGLVLDAEEGRGKLRNAQVSRMQTQTLGYPNENLGLRAIPVLKREEEPAEVKHLSRQRKRKQLRCRK